MAQMMNLIITNNLTSFASERRFPTDLQLAALKGKLELITGCAASLMRLQLYDKENKFICDLSNDCSTLESYKVGEGMRIHVINEDPTKKAGEYEDLTQVEKYEITEEVYDQRTDSVRNFLKQKKMGRFSDEAKDAEDKAKRKEEQEEQLAKSVAVGNRCEVRVPKQPTKRGAVRFVGPVHFKPGWWIGVQYDEPLGKNDGSVQGKRYFECPVKYGAFVRPSQVTVGDFPEEDFGLEDDEM